MANNKNEIICIEISSDEDEIEFFEIIPAEKIKKEKINNESTLFTRRDKNENINIVKEVEVIDDIDEQSSLLEITLNSTGEENCDNSLGTKIKLLNNEEIQSVRTNNETLNNEEPQTKSELKDKSLIELQEVMLNLSKKLGISPQEETQPETLESSSLINSDNKAARFNYERHIGSIIAPVNCIPLVPIAALNYNSTFSTAVPTLPSLPLLPFQKTSVTFPVQYSSSDIIYNQAISTSLTSIRTIDQSHHIPSSSTAFSTTASASPGTIDPSNSTAFSSAPPILIDQSHIPSSSTTSSKVASSSDIIYNQATPPTIPTSLTSIRTIDQSHHMPSSAFSTAASASPRTISPSHSPVFTSASSRVIDQSHLSPHSTAFSKTSLRSLNKLHVTSSSSAFSTSTSPKEIDQSHMSPLDSTNASRYSQYSTDLHLISKRTSHEETKKSRFNNSNLDKEIEETRNNTVPEYLDDKIYRSQDWDNIGISKKINYIIPKKSFNNNNSSAKSPKTNLDSIKHNSSAKFPKTNLDSIKHNSSAKFPKTNLDSKLDKVEETHKMSSEGNKKTSNVKGKRNNSTCISHGETKTRKIMENVTHFTTPESIRISEKESDTIKNHNKISSIVPAKIRKRRSTYDTRNQTDHLIFESEIRNNESKSKIIDLKGNSASKDEREFKKSSTSRKKIITKQNDENAKNEESLSDNLEENRGNTGLTVKIKALREIFKNSLTSKQIQHVDNIIKSIITQNENKINSNSSTDTDEDAAINQNCFRSKQKKQRTNRPTISKTELEKNSLTKELQSLHQQINQYYDRDEILSSEGKTRQSHEIALKKIQNNYITEFQNDQVEVPVDDDKVKIVKAPPKRRKTICIERSPYNIYDDNNLLSDPPMKGSESSDDSDSSNDTVDFSSHLKEKHFLNNQATTNELKQKCFEKEIKIIVNKLSQEEILQHNNNGYKPLSIIASHPFDENHLKKAQYKSLVLQNINSNHHCKNENFIKKCIICNKSSKNIVSHYVHCHTKNRYHEIYCSRLPHQIIEQFENDSICAELLQSKPYIYRIECIFCGSKIDGSNTELHEHYATHTGEYAWGCNSCNKKSPFRKRIIQHCKNHCKKNAKPNRFYVYKKENQIIGTFCIECNFIQLNEANVIRHLQKQHSITKEPEKFCKNLILVKLNADSLLASDSIEQSSSKLETDIIEIFGEDLSDLNDDGIWMEYFEKEINDESIRIHNEADSLSSPSPTDYILTDDAHEIEIKPEIFNEEKQLHYEYERNLSNSEEEAQKSDGIKYFNELYNNENENNSDKQKEEQKLSSSELMKANSSVVSLPKKHKTDKKMQCETTKKETKVDLIKRSPLKPWIQHINFDKQKSLKILEKINLSHFFKCMLCPFSSNLADQILSHLKEHTSNSHLQERTDDKFECCYCTVTLRDPEDLINHIKIKHNECNFQCGKCFYRSYSPYSVKLHIQKYHNKSDQIITCDGPEIKFSEQFRKIIEKRRKYLKPFICHLCPERNTHKFYLKEDFENHFKLNHHSAIFCKCDGHGLICCLYCDFETNSKNQIKTHMSDFHPNREQYVAARFRNPKFEKDKDSTEPNSTIIAYLSELPSDKYFMQTRLLKQKLETFNENKETFIELVSKTSETLWNMKFLSNELAKLNRSQIDKEFLDSRISLEVCQKELYEMAKIAISSIKYDKFKCFNTHCETEFESFEQLLQHINIKHKALLNLNYECQYCDESYRLSEFKAHFNRKHAQHKYFCYLCGITDFTASAVENHLEKVHHISRTTTKSMLPAHPEEFIAIVPIEINLNDSSTFTLHMRNLLKAKNFHSKLKFFFKPANIQPNINEISTLELPNYIIAERDRYKCPKSNCSFVAKSENLLEEHFKNIHRTLKSFKCSHCLFKIEEEIKNFDLIKDHLRLHNEILFVCTICPFYDHQRQIVQKHIRSEHKSQMNITKMVRSHKNGKYKLTFETALEEGHIFLHMNACLICKKYLKEPDKIIEHLHKKHSVAVSYECQYCKSTYPELNEVIGHINKDHKKVLKLLCKFEYTESHSKSIHNRIKTTNELEENIKDTLEPLITTSEKSSISPKKTQNGKPSFYCSEITMTGKPSISAETTTTREKSEKRTTSSEKHLTSTEKSTVIINEQQTKKINDLQLIESNPQIVHVYNYICEHCNFETSDRSKLFMHKKQEHQINKNETNIRIPSSPSNKDQEISSSNDKPINSINITFSSGNNNNNTDRNQDVLESINSCIGSSATFHCSNSFIDFDNQLNFHEHNCVERNFINDDCSLKMVPNSNLISSEIGKQSQSSSFDTFNEDVLELPIPNISISSLPSTTTIVQSNIKSNSELFPQEVRQHNSNTMDVFELSIPNISKSSSPSTSTIVQSNIKSNSEWFPQEIRQRPIPNISKSSSPSTSTIVQSNIKSNTEWFPQEIRQRPIPNISSPSTSTIVPSNINNIVTSTTLNEERVKVSKLKRFEVINGITYKCHYCPFKENSINVLLKHWKHYHSNENLFHYNVLFLLQCTKCKRKGTFSELKHHFYHSHPNTDFILRKVSNNAKTIICSECNIAFNKTTELINHSKIMHWNLMDQHKSESETFSQNLFDDVEHIGYPMQLSKCNVCSTEFLNEYQCHQHFVQQHLNDGILYSPNHFYREYPIIFCNICKFNTNNLRNGVQHFHEMHTKSFKCIYCQCDFNRYYLLIQHYKISHNNLNEQEFILNWIYLLYEFYSNNLLWSFANGLVTTTFQLRNTKLALKQSVMDLMQEIDYTEMPNF